MLQKHLSQEQINLLDIEKVSHNLTYWGDQIVPDVIAQAKFFDFMGDNILMEEKLDRIFKSKLKDLFYIKDDKAREAGERLIKIFNETKSKAGDNNSPE